VGLAHGLDFGTDDIEGQTECSSFRATKRFAGEVEEFPGVFVFQSGTGYNMSDGFRLEIELEQHTGVKGF
jgi:hypothetical protein